MSLLTTRTSNRSIRDRGFDLSPFADSCSENERTQAARALLTAFATASSRFYGSLPTHEHIVWLWYRVSYKLAPSTSKRPAKKSCSSALSFKSARPSTIGPHLRAEVIARALSLICSNDANLSNLTDLHLIGPASAIIRCLIVGKREKR